MRIGPKYKIARRLGDPSIFGKTSTAKFALSESRKKGKVRKHMGQRTEFALQLIEKQKARYMYGLPERQLANYVRSSKGKSGKSPAESLFENLETRLDNVIFRLGFANTRAFARQLVSHGHVKVNGRRVTIPSYQVRKGDAVGVRTESKRSAAFNNLSERLGAHRPPAWLSLDHTDLSGKVLDRPVFAPGESTVNFGSIVEFYSRV